MHSKIRNIITFSLNFLILCVIALAASAVAAFVFSDAPLRTIAALVTGPLRTAYAFGNMLSGATPLIFGGLGVCLAMRAGSFNLGGEGQLYGGAVAALLAGLAAAPLGVWGIVPALLAAALSGGLVAAVSGFCQWRFRADTLITSFLISSALVFLCDYLVTGPLQDKTSALQTTVPLPSSLWLSRLLPPSSLSTAFLCAIAVVCIVSVFFYRSLAGYEIKMYGLNPVFAQYGGIKSGKVMLLSLFLSGALYGLAGGFALIGNYHQVIKGFSGGMGWNGVGAALLAGFNPVAVVPAAVFFSWISAGVRAAMQTSDVTPELAQVIQGLVFIIASSKVITVWIRTGRKRHA
jgi:simple sugar transport system permease protein